MKIHYNITLHSSIQGLVTQFRELLINLKIMMFCEKYRVHCFV